MPCPPCPNCQSEFVYQDQRLFICPECAREWNPAEAAAEDTVTIKDLKVKGSSLVLKVGTKAVIKRLMDSKDHQLDCKVDGVGDMMVTAHFVKKA